MTVLEPLENMSLSSSLKYDMIIVGSGVSGSFIAHELTRANMKCLLLEAGKFFDKTTYPKKEIDATSQLFWSGGLELNHTAEIAFLRPKCVGGGSIVNQALVDRFDDIALDSWREHAGVSFFSTSEMKPWYEKAESELCIQTIAEKDRNGNAQVFKKGCEQHGYQYAALRRAQSNCQCENGNDCIACLFGCRRDSKQSMPVTVLKKALKNGLTLIPQFEAQAIERKVDGTYAVHGRDVYGNSQAYISKAITLASGAIGNSKLLFNSELGRKIPNIGNNFFCHPQFMFFGIHEEKINAHKGAFQSLKSADNTFRKNNFKLENVFATPASIGMLFPGLGKRHMNYMKKITHMSSVEVCIRDVNPGRIVKNKKGNISIIKSLYGEDKATYKKGKKAICDILQSGGAKEIIDGQLGIGLHLMGGLNMGSSDTSVTSPEFNLHGFKDIFCADSSIFPNAPGINPSLTIMALSILAASKIQKQVV